MELSDFCQHYNRLYRCFPAAEEQTLHQCWGRGTVPAAAGNPDAPNAITNSAGGCSDFSTFSRNPLFRVTVTGTAAETGAADSDSAASVATKIRKSTRKRRQQVPGESGGGDEARRNQEGRLATMQAGKMKTQKEKTHGPLTKWEAKHTPRV
eukprot:COSAG06_NODE_30200_length_543_cov_0.698198_2_plen_151_part_01